MARCGIDFGTSNSAVALPTGEVLKIDPGAAQVRLFRSVLFFPEDSREVLAGNDAIERYQEDPEGRFIQSVKTWLPSMSFTQTLIRNASFKLEDLIGVLLRVLRERAVAHLGAPIDHLVLGRPAVFSPDLAIDARAEARLATAAKTAGFSSVSFLIEPIAAALAYEATLDRDELVLVADFGAGTTDLTLMRLGPSRREQKDRRADVVASSGVYVGGDRFDAVLMRHKLLPFFGQGSTYLVGLRRMPIPTYVLTRLLSWSEMSSIRDKSTQELLFLMLRSSDQKEGIQALHDLVMHNLGYRLFRAIEKAKVELSSVQRSRIDFEEDRVRLHVEVTREEFERFSEPLIGELERCTDALLDRVPSALKIDSVFLTGGSSHLPAVQKLFARKFGQARLRGGDAFTSVAEGLGRASAGALFQSSTT